MRCWMIGSLALAIVVGVLPCTKLSGEDEKEKAWGNVKGRVIWAGDSIPSREAEVIDKDKVHCLERGPILSEKWVVNSENKGIRWVYVWLAHDPAAPTKKLPVHPSLQEIKVKEVAIDQPCCVFEPHAVALREGQDLLVKNSSAVPHDVRWAGNPLINPGNDVLVPARGSYTIKGLRAEKTPILISCSIHFWMKAYLRVFDHPYFAITDLDGNFEIALAPAGDCRLVIWHESAGWRGGAAGKAGEKITIKGGETADLGKLEFKP